MSAGLSDLQALQRVALIEDTMIEQLAMAFQTTSIDRLAELMTELVRRRCGWPSGRSTGTPRRAN